MSASTITLVFSSLGAAWMGGYLAGKYLLVSKQILDISTG